MFQTPLPFDYTYVTSQPAADEPMSTAEVYRLSRRFMCSLRSWKADGRIGVLSSAERSAIGTKQRSCYGN
jgi:hypothetical protein